MLRTQHIEWQDAIRLAVGGNKNGILLAVNVEVGVMLALSKKELRAPKLRTLFSDGCHSRQSYAVE